MQCVITCWLALLWLPSLLFAAIRTPERFFHWPAMLTIGILFSALLLGPLDATPWLFKKLAKLAISICLLKALCLLLNSADLRVPVAPFGLTRHYSGFALMMTGIFVWFVFVFRLIFSREPTRAIGRLLQFPRTRPLFCHYFPQIAPTESATGLLDSFWIAILCPIPSHFFDK
jgi:hypothetical protein